MEFSAQPSMFASRPMRLSGATSGASRGRRSWSRRLRRLLELRRGERFQYLPDGGGALAELARDALDAQLVRRGELPAALLLHEFEHGGRVERGMLDELQLDEFGSRVDPRDAQRPPEDAQAMALDQRARRARQVAEAVDQLFLHRLDALRALAIGEALVEHQALVHVGAVARGQERREVQVDLGRDLERLRQVGLASGLQ